MTDLVRKHRVLLVDDYADVREMYREYLQFLGFETVQASNGEEAIARAIDSHPDVIVMDLSLPVMDGWEAMRRLKADARTAAIPILAMTGHTLAGGSDGAKDAGCHGVITKPCLPENVVAEIRKALDLSTAGAGGG